MKSQELLYEVDRNSITIPVLGQQCESLLWEFTNFGKLQPLIEEVFKPNSQKILVALSTSEKTVNSQELQRNASVSRSTFFREVSVLVDLQLVEKKELRGMFDNRIRRTVGYKLTPKGRTVAEKLQQVSKNLSLGKMEGSLNEQVMDCIVAALNSFGEHFGHSVYVSYERLSKKPRETIPDNIDDFLMSTSLLFGAQGANSIERTIAGNLTANFRVELEGHGGEGLSALISLLRKKGGESSSRLVASTSSESS